MEVATMVRVRSLRTIPMVQKPAKAFLWVIEHTLVANGRVILSFLMLPTSFSKSSTPWFVKIRTWPQFLHLNVWQMVWAKVMKFIVEEIEIG